MKKLLLITTALTAFATTGALAQSDTAAEPGAMTDQEMGAPFFTEDMDVTTPVDQDMYFTSSADQFLTTHILGQTIYNGISDESSAIGDVNDIILAPDGSAEAVVIGVGGFLGIGEKEVAVSFDNINVFNQDGSTWLTIDANREDLEAAPAFDRSVFEGNFATRTAENDMMADEADPMLGEDLNVDVMGGSSNEDITVGSADNNGADTDMTGMPAESNLVPVELDAISANELIGARTYAANDQDIGEIGDVILNDEGGVDAYIIDVGGFLGIGEKPVAVAAAELEIMRGPNGWLSVHTGLSKQELEAQPTYDAEAYDLDPNAVLLR